MIGPFSAGYLPIVFMVGLSIGFFLGRSSGRKQILSMIEKQIHRVK
jgi:hypothetical protein